MLAAKKYIIKKFYRTTKKNTQSSLKFIEDNRDDFKEAFNIALALLQKSKCNKCLDQALSALEVASSAKKKLKLNGFDLFPLKRLKHLIRLVEKKDLEKIRHVVKLIHSHAMLQREISNSDIGATNVRLKIDQLRIVDTELAKSLTSSKLSAKRIQLQNNAMRVFLCGAVWAVSKFGAGAEKLAAVLKASNSIWTGGRVTRGIGYFMDLFLSRNSLFRTGVETSWGFRFIVPGTAGFIGNAGPWVMLYSGTLHDYSRMKVPFHVNPGVTLATDIGTITQNRPGFGVGTALPFASGYVDKARSKLLIGRDGILYIRLGEWENRGPYFTVAAFIPLTPFMNITWNASIFSPGFGPLIRWSRPVTLWVRGQADWLWGQIKRIIS